MKKKSSYQKLKEQNASLMKDIYAMVMQQGTPETNMVIKRYEIKFSIENAAWFGSTDKYNGTFVGILKYTS